MKLRLIRHALPRRVENTDGPADPGLTDVGREQARRLAARLGGRHVTSPNETARLHAARDTLDPRPAP